MTYSIADLFKIETAASFLARGLAEAQSLGLLVTSWRVGDPTRATFSFLARALSTKDGILSEFGKSAFLSKSSGDWLTLVAADVYNVPRPEATYATSQVTVHNTGGGVYPIVARDWTFKNSVTGKTYRNVSAMPTLVGGSFAVIDVEATESGSASNALLNEIDALVTTKLGVVVVASTAAVGLDQQDDPALKDQCNASRGALSPDGPEDAYEYVARNATLTGVADVTRASADGDNPTNTVTIYVAGTSGSVAGASIPKVQAAIERWATPLCTLPTVVNATQFTIDVTFSAHGYNTLPAGAQATAAAALLLLMRGLPIGKGSGYDVDPTLITTAIRNAVPEIATLPAYTPITPLHIAAGQVPVLGSVTLTEV